MPFKMLDTPPLYQINEFALDVTFDRPEVRHFTLVANWFLSQPVDILKKNLYYFEDRNTHFTEKLYTMLPRLLRF